MPIYFLLATLLFITNQVVAEQTINVACSDSVPPYVLADSNQGIVLDILRAALHQKNIHINPLYGSNEDNLNHFISGDVDAILVAPREALIDAVISDQALMSFHNYAISLDKNHFTVAKIDDLKNLRLGAFSLASRILPPAFRQVVNQTAEYREFSNQQQQVEALLKGEVDVIVLERMLFRQIRHQDPLLTRQTIRYHNIFTPTHYHTTFANEEVAKAFNEGLIMIQNSGEYQRILDTYEQLLNSYLVTP